jgi:hypothetical protein
LSNEHQPDAIALAVADDLFDRVGGDAAGRLVSLGDARFEVLEADAIDLARALGAAMPAEPAEPHPQYLRVAFDLDAVLPKPGQYVVMTHDDPGTKSVCCVLALAGHDVDLELPGEPLQPGHALIAAWDLAELKGAA